MSVQGITFRCQSADPCVANRTFQLARRAEKHASRCAKIEAAYKSRDRSGPGTTTPRSYSECSIVMGSRRMARSAGIQLAASATTVSTPETLTKVSRSWGETPKSNPAMR